MKLVEKLPLSLLATFWLTCVHDNNIHTHIVGIFYLYYILFIYVCVCVCVCVSLSLSLSLYIYIYIYMSESPVYNLIEQEDFMRLIGMLKWRNMVAVFLTGFSLCKKSCLTIFGKYLNKGLSPNFASDIN